MYSYIKTVPDIVEVSPSRIVVVPDVHQDLQKAKRCLLLAGVVNKNGTWVGGSTVVVQVGDQVDGAPRVRTAKPERHVCHADLARDVAVLTYFNDMHRKAQNKGGAVYSLIGNHELMNVMGSFDYANTYGCEACERERRKAFAPGGTAAVLLATTRVVCLKIGRIIFVHAGVVPRHARALDIPRLNRVMTETFLGNPVNKTDKNYFDSMCVDFDGVLTHRYYMPGAQIPAGEAREALAALEADHMVIGHNAHGGGVTALYDGQLVFVCDPGISKSVMDAPPTVLEISHRRQSWKPEFSVLIESYRT